MTVDREVIIHIKYLIIQKDFIQNNIPHEKQKNELFFLVVTPKFQALVTTCYQWIYVRLQHRILGT
jgi:hypothetical protein